MNKNKFQIYQTGNAIDKINTCHTIKKHKSKPTGGYTSQTINELVSLNDFIKLIGSGYSFRHCFDINQIKMNINEIIPPNSLNRLNRIYRNNIMYNNKMTMNVLQKKSAIKYCSFQCVFFDIDDCNTGYLELTKKLQYKPNIVYETFSYTPQKTRFRLVYILDKLIPCIYYSDVYNLIAKQIKKITNLDDCAKNPTQTFFGTNKNVYTINNHYYSICISENDDNIRQSIPLFNDSTVANFDKPPVSPECNIVPYNIERNFYNECCSFTMKKILEYYANKCILVDYEIPNTIFEKQIYNTTGLLKLPTYFFVNGRRTKIIMNDNRKYYIREVIANLLLLMNNSMVPEDLIYNVFNWCNEHINFNKTVNNHILNNKIIIQLCLETYNKFHNLHSTEYDLHLDKLKNKYRSSGRKNNINPYYFRLHIDDDTFCCNRFELWTQHPVYKTYWNKYPPITLEQLEIEQTKIRKSRCDKQHPHSETTRLILYYLKCKFSNKTIIEKLKTDHNITTSSQNISKIKKIFQL